MTDLLIALGENWAKILFGFLAFALLLGLIPRVLVVLITVIYPESDPRREELRGEFDAIDVYLKRVCWAGDLIGLGLSEGVRARWRAVREKRRKQPVDIVEASDVARDDLVAEILASFNERASEKAVADYFWVEEGAVDAPKRVFIGQFKNKPPTEKT